MQSSPYASCKMKESLDFPEYWQSDDKAAAIKTAVTSIADLPQKRQQHAIIRILSSKLRIDRPPFVLLLYLL